MIDGVTAQHSHKVAVTAERVKNRQVMNCCLMRVNNVSDLSFVNSMIINNIFT